MIRPVEIATMAEVAFHAPPNSVYLNIGCKPAATARGVTYLLLRNHLEMSTTEVGRELGRDHTTVLAGCRSTEKRARTDDAFARTLARLDKAIEFRRVADERLETSPIETAEKIMLNPRRNAPSATTYEIAAVASALSDLWDMARTAEAVLGNIQFTENGIEEITSEQASAMCAYSETFLNHMETLRFCEGRKDDEQDS